MNNLARIADDIGNNLTCAGLGLEAIADLTSGTDEHYLTADQINGLRYAVIALARVVREAGNTLCDAVAKEVGHA